MPTNPAIAKTSTSTARTARRGTKHEALTEELLALARSLQPGDRFPSQPELMRRYSVSDRTVLRSLDDLQKAGWIVRRHGAGTFIADPRGPVSAEAPSPARTDSRIIAALALGLSHTGFFRLGVDHLAAQTEAAGLSLVCHVARSATNYEEAVPLEALKPCGFVLFNYQLAPLARHLIARGYRTVVVGTPPVGKEADVPCVYTDQDYGGHLATRHLLDLGHRRLAYHRVRPESLPDTFRWHGHQRALEEARATGLDVQDEVWGVDIVNGWRDDPESCAAFFARPEAPTGLLAWNDNEAATLLGVLHRAGVRVPQDVSLVGFNAQAESRQSSPVLTTMDIHTERLMQIVMDLMTRPNPPAPQATVLVPHLLRGGSCAPPKELA